MQQEVCGCWQNQRVHILEMESFEQTFGAKAQRKRPKVAADNMEVTANNYSYRAIIFRNIALITALIFLKF